MLRHIAYNLTTGKILECDCINVLKRAVKTNQRYDNGGCWVCAHKRYANDTIDSVLTRKLGPAHVI